MRKVSSSRQLHYVKLVQKIRNIVPALSRSRVAIYLTEHVLTLGWQTSCNPGTKKRLGSQLGELALTQSYALSRINKIEQFIKGSPDIALILPKGNFSYFSVKVPPDLPPYETRDALIWAAEQAGFSPISEWYWEACRDNLEYKLTLISKQSVVTILDRLQLQPSRIKHLIPAPALENDDLNPNWMGPWLDIAGIQAVTFWLGNRLSTPSLNLFNNIAQRQQKATLFASVQSFALILSLFTTTAMLCQAGSADDPLPEPIAKEETLPPHPLQLHGALWSTLYRHGADVTSNELNSSTVALQSINYRNHRWQITLHSRDTEHAQQWLQEVETQLNKSAPATTWKFNLLSSRLEEASAVTHVEITL